MSVTVNGPAIGQPGLVSGAGNVAFTTAVPMTSAAGSVMVPQSVGSVLAFTVGAGAVPLGACYVRLIADGANTPTFTGFTEVGSSAGWVNTAGILNLVSFWYDGTSYYYSVQQPANVTAVTVPQIVSATIPTGATNTITILYSAALDAGSVPAASAYTLSGSSGAVAASSVAVSGSTVTVTMSRAATSGETITASYVVPSTGAVRSNADQTNAPGFTSRACTQLQFVRYTTLTNHTESGNGTTGWIYTGTGSFNLGGCADPSLSIPSGQDGIVSVALPNKPGTTAVQFSLGTSAATMVGNTVQQCAINFESYTNANYRTQSPSGGTATSGTAMAAGDVIRMRRVGSNVYAEVSKDSEATWTLLATFTGITTAALYPLISAQNTVQMGPVKGVGLA